jgi:hypothetical protein
MSSKYTLHVVLSHYGTFLFIIICYPTSYLAIFHAHRRETILIQNIDMKQGIIQHSLCLI